MHQTCTMTIGPVRRHYYSRAERIGWLEGYAEQLAQELAGVRERIEALRAPMPAQPASRAEPAAA